MPKWVQRYQQCQFRYHKFSSGDPKIKPENFKNQCDTQNPISKQNETQTMVCLPESSHQKVMNCLPYLSQTMRLVLAVAVAAP